MHPSSSSNPTHSPSAAVLTRVPRIRTKVETTCVLHIANIKARYIQCTIICGHIGASNVPSTTVCNLLCGDRNQTGAYIKPARIKATDESHDVGAFRVIVHVVGESMTIGTDLVLEIGNGGIAIGVVDGKAAAAEDFPVDVEWRAVIALFEVIIKVRRMLGGLRGRVEAWSIGVVCPR